MIDAGCNNRCATRSYQKTDRGKYTRVQANGGSGKSVREYIVGVPNPSQMHDGIHESPNAGFFSSWFFSVGIVALATISGLCTAFTCFVLYIRPVLQSLDETCKATADAAEKLESAADELEQAALMFQEELPPAVTAVEEASKEFQELGSTLNALSGGLTGFAPRSRIHRAKNQSESSNDAKGDTALQGGYPDQPTDDSIVPQVKAIQTAARNSIATTQDIQKQTLQGIGKVASDIASLARTLTPAMEMWQSRLESLVSKVETEAKTNGPQDSTDIFRSGLLEGSDAQQWISAWKKKTDPPVSENGVEASSPEEQDEGIESKNETETTFNGVCVEIDNFGAQSASEEENNALPLAEEGATNDSLVNGHSRPESAVAVIEALYKAEQAAEHAAQASDDLQVAVARAQLSRAFEDISDSLHSDGMAPFTHEPEKADHVARGQSDAGDTILR